MKITLDMQAIRFLTLFENVTNVAVKDCIVNDNIVYFIVEEGKAGLAIGRNGSLIKNVERMIGRKVKVYEYSSDLFKFVKNLIPQCKQVEMREDGGKKTILVKVSKKDKGLVIGRGGEKIKIYKEILKRVHNISDIMVR